MSNVDDWPKPEYIRYMLSQLAGPGSERSSEIFRLLLKSPSRRYSGCEWTRKPKTSILFVFVILIRADVS